MRRRFFLAVVAASGLQFLLLGQYCSVFAQSAPPDYDHVWNEAIVALATFVQIAAPPDAASLSADLLPSLDAERARFNAAMLKLIVANPPDTAMRRHLTLVPIGQEISTGMVLMTDGIRAGDIAATEAARRWLTDRLVDMRVAIARLDRRH